MFQPRGGGKRQAPTFDVIAPGVAKHEEEIVLAPGAEPAADPNLVLRVAVAAAEFGLPIAPGTLRNLKKCPIGDRNWTDESRELFIRLLASGPALLNVWEDIDFIDVPGKLIPEWLGVRNRPSASAAHRYTIDRHMVEVVTRLCCSPASCMTSANDRGWPTMRRKALGMRPWSWNAWDSTATSSAGSRCWYASI